MQSLGAGRRPDPRRFNGVRTIGNIGVNQGDLHGVLIEKNNLLIRIQKRSRLKRGNDLAGQRLARRWVSLGLERWNRNRGRNERNRIPQNHDQKPARLRKRMPHGALGCWPHHLQRHSCIAARTRKQSLVEQLARDVLEITVQAWVESGLDPNDNPAGQVVLKLIANRCFFAFQRFSQCERNTVVKNGGRHFTGPWGPADFVRGTRCGCPSSIQTPTRRRRVCRRG